MPDYCIDEVADHAIGLLLALSRGITFLDRAIHAGTWDFRRGGELRRASGMRLGIVGLGRIGAATARRAQALRFEVVATDPRAPEVDGVRLMELDELLATSDIVSLHAWLDPSTRHMLDAAALARMKPGALPRQYLARRSGRPGRARGGAPIGSSRRRGARRPGA